MPNKFERILESKFIPNSLLEASVLFAYDRNGFKRHQQYFNPADTYKDLSNKTYVVTGANSGIGFATAKNLAQKKARVFLFCRRSKAGKVATKKIQKETQNPKVYSVPCDLSQAESIVKASRILLDEYKVVKLCGLIHNAGTYSDKPDFLSAKIETTWMVHVYGPYLLSMLLLEPLKKAKPGRVVWVSSGGMYIQKLTAKKINQKPKKQNGFVTYAITKRAGISLMQKCAQKYPEIFWAGMHPGWVNTPIVIDNLPVFQKTLQTILRDPDQGADTSVWLASHKEVNKLQNGQFWFDRKKAKTYPLPFTEESQKVRDMLFEKVNLFARTYPLK